jgi:hypothetical protein
MKVKKGIVIAAIFILIILTATLAQEPVGEDIVVVGTGTPEINDTALEAPATPADQGVCTAQSNILTTGWGSVKSAAGWVIARDYLSAASNAGKWLIGLSLGMKILIVLAILLIIFLIWNYNFRNTRANNMKKARKHHLKGEEAHLRGDEEKAREHYEKAREYREKGQDQW